MRYIIYITLLVISGCQNYGKLDSHESAHNLMEIVIENEYEELGTKIVLEDKQQNSFLTNCIEYYFNDSANVIYREEILQKASVLEENSWAFLNIPHVEMVRSDSIKESLNNSKDGISYFEKFDKRYYSISSPIFFGQDICMIYVRVHCGLLCGEAELKIFRRNWRGWKQIDTYCRSIL